MNAIINALQNPTEPPTFESRFEINGVANKFIKILTYIEKNGKSMTAYPLVEELKKL